MLSAGRRLLILSVHTEYEILVFPQDKLSWVSCKRPQFIVESFLCWSDNFYAASGVLCSPPGTELYQYRQERYFVIMLSKKRLNQEKYSQQVLIESRVWEWRVLCLSTWSMAQLKAVWMTLHKLTNSWEHFRWKLSWWIAATQNGDSGVDARRVSSFMTCTSVESLVCAVLTEEGG